MVSRIVEERKIEKQSGERRGSGGERELRYKYAISRMYAVTHNLGRTNGGISIGRR
jgi:hypothetical protein